mmetsp:Transcript_37899/g.70608  ORF Transcript_37899/g.70608 Transcript_37899/m.70608 type:complete len:132 (-) Transcript_37899:361-756(-)
MSYNDDDVIELGADGTFDIPSPPKNRPPVSSHLDSVEPTFVPPQISLSDEILQQIKPGEFRVYLNKSTKQTYIVVHLLSTQKPEVKAYESYISVSCSDGQCLKIDISGLNVDVKTTHVQHWSDFLTIRFSK